MIGHCTSLAENKLALDVVVAQHVTRIADGLMAKPEFIIQGERLETLFGTYCFGSPLRCHDFGDIVLPYLLHGP